MLLDVDHEATVRILHHYIERLGLPTDRLRVTTERATFAQWLGRRTMSAALGGAYAFLPRTSEHAVLVNLARIDFSQPKALEVVVAEELVHMRDRLDGDLRRHAHHGHDRIARRVAALTGATLAEVRSALLPVARRPLRYVYACPVCHARVERRVQGRWSCGRCSRAFDPRRLLRLVEDRGSALSA